MSVKTSLHVGSLAAPLTARFADKRQNFPWRSLTGDTVDGWNRWATPSAVWRRASGVWDKEKVRALCGKKAGEPKGLHSDIQRLEFLTSRGRGPGPQIEHLCYLRTGLEAGRLRAGIAQWLERRTRD